MSRKKQIEPVKEIKEIADIIHREDGPLVVLFYNDSLTLAEKLYNAGYRKASDVAREIFEEIRAESSYCVASQNGVEIYHTKMYNISAIKLDELKKKYESEGEG